jgi:hypothetical protein
MAQSEPVAESGEDKSTANKVLWILSALANLVAVSSFLATIIKSNPILILLITIAAVVLFGLVYLAKQTWHLTGRAGLVTTSIITILSAVLAVIAWSLLANSSLTPVKVTIIDPQPNGNVSLQYLVKGTVSDSNATAYVIVHPLRVSDMWVQQIPIVDGEGNWQSSCIFGHEGLGAGEQFQVIALATNDNFLVNWATGNSLSEGDTLTRLPQKSNKSALITVTRPH